MDVWAEFGPIFGAWVDNLAPGILLRGMDRDTQRYIVQYASQYLRDVGPVLENAQTGEEIYPTTKNEMIESLLSDTIDGMVWLEILRDGLKIPQLGFFVPTGRTMTLHYIAGTWKPISLIAFLELLRWIDGLGEHITIEMERGTAPDLWCDKFNAGWRSYLADKR